MIFFNVGILFAVVGLIYMVFPSKKRTNKYGYRTGRAKISDESFHYAQKIAAKTFLFGGLLVALLGFLLKKTGFTQFFILELLLIVIPVALIIYFVERRLEQFNDKFDEDANTMVKENRYETINDRR